MLEAKDNFDRQTKGNSKTNEGTTFDIYLPLSDNSEISDDGENSTLLKYSEKYSILIVEDEEILLDMISETLTEKGHRVKKSKIK